MEGINPTIQERGFIRANEYWQKILRSKELRILYGLQNPKNNSPMVQTYSNTITSCRPNIQKGWSKGSEPEYTGLSYNDQYYSLIIRDDQLLIRSKVYDQDTRQDVIGPESLVFAVPKDIKGKVKRVNFLKAIGYTLITDPINIDEYIPKMTSFSRFNVPEIAGGITA